MPSSRGGLRRTFSPSRRPRDGEGVDDRDIVVPVPPWRGLGNDGWPAQAALADDPRPSASNARRNQRRQKAEPTAADAAAACVRRELSTGVVRRLPDVAVGQSHTPSTVGIPSSS